MQPTAPARRIAEIVEHPGFSKDAWYALEMYRSYPIPVRTARGVELAFLLGPQQANPMQGLWYSVPTRLAFLDASSGQEREVRPLAPGEFGQPVPVNGVLGRVPPLTVEAATERPKVEQALYAALDVVVPAYAARRTQLTEPERRAAAAVRDTFPSLSAGPLRPYYDALGREFNTWLAAAR